MATAAPIAAPVTPFRPVATFCVVVPEVRNITQKFQGLDTIGSLVKQIVQQLLSLLKPIPFDQHVGLLQPLLNLTFL